MILLPLILTLGYVYVLRNEYRSGEPDGYDMWLLEPKDLEIVE